MFKHRIPGDSNPARQVSEERLYNHTWIWNFIHTTTYQCTLLCVYSTPSRCLIRRYNELSGLCWFVFNQLCTLAASTGFRWRLEWHVYSTWLPRWWVEAKARVFCLRKMSHGVINGTSDGGVTGPFRCFRCLGVAGVTRTGGVSWLSVQWMG